MHFILHASAAGSFPQALSKERETELLIKMEAGDDEARKTLIEHNLRLVAHIAKEILLQRRRSGRYDINRYNRAYKGDLIL